MGDLSGKGKIKRSIFSCTSCAINETDPANSKSKRKWRPNICIGNVVAVLALLYIVITQITLVQN